VEFKAVAGMVLSLMVK